MTLSVRRERSSAAICMLWVALCFGLTSAVYLSWLDRLVKLAGSRSADWLSLVAGYLCQAVGTGATAFMNRQWPSVDEKFSLLIILFAAISVPALLTDSAAGVICFGLVMNLLCGMLAGYYLYVIARRVSPERRSLVFGGGYAIATVVVGLLALIDGGRLLHGRTALLIYLPAAALLALWTRKLPPVAEMQIPSAQQRTIQPMLAAGIIVLISAVKNLGFTFPSADIGTGLMPEIARIPYALGLIAAGWINDRDRRQGMICTVAALIVPFIMLGLSHEPLPRTIFWGLDYLFFAFFTVFRAVLFLDIAHQSRRWELAPLGLMTGRLGDAAGTAVGLALADSATALIVVSVALFVAAVFLLFRLYQKLYEPQVAERRSEQEVFETFSMHHDLSSREREVLRLILADRTNGEIAEALFITENTVKYHVRNLLQKTGCKNRAELKNKYRLLLYPQQQPE